MFINERDKEIDEADNQHRYIYKTQREKKVNEVFRGLKITINAKTNQNTNTRE